MTEERSKSRQTPFYFDSGRICIGDFCIARNTGLMAFVYLLKAVGIPCTTPEEGTVCVDHATLFHNLHGKCHFRFSESKSGNRVFSRVNFVIDPDLYPGLKDVPRTRRMKSLKDFVAVSLNDRLGLNAPAAEGGFVKRDEQSYESPLVRVKHEIDHYHAVITVSYRERQASEGQPELPDMSELLKRVDALEQRVATVEKENRELRKVNDMILNLFGGLKPAHDLTHATIPEGRQETPSDADASDDSDKKRSGTSGGRRPSRSEEELSPERRNVLINKYSL